MSLPEASPAGGSISRKRVRDPFRLLKALLIGGALGAIAVMLKPYLGSQAAVHRPTAVNSRLTDSAIADAKNRRAALKLAPPPVPRNVVRATAEPSVPTETTPPQATKAPSVETPNPPPFSAEKKEPAPSPSAPAQPAEKASASVPPALKPASEVLYPKLFSPDEMTELLKPVLSFALSDADVGVLKGVLANAGKGIDANRAAIRQISDSSARKFAEWRVLRVSQAPAEVQFAFASANPLFPPPALDIRLERAVFMSEIPPAQVFKVFAVRRPVTGPGKASLGAAYIATGELERGKKLVREAWIRHDFDAAAEARYIARFGATMTDETKAAHNAFRASRVKRKEDELRQVALASTATAGAFAKSRLMARRKAAILENKRAIYRKAYAAPVRSYARAPKVIYRRAPGKPLRRGVLLDPAVIGTPARFALGAGGFAVSRGARWRHDAQLVPRTDSGAVPPPVAPALNPAVKDNAATAPLQNDGAPAKPPASATAQPASPKETPAAQTPAAAPVPAAAATAPTTPPKPQDAKPSPPKTQQKGASQALNLAKELRADGLTLLTRLSLLKRQRSDKKMWSLLRSARSETADLADTERWWDFRRTEIRRALNLGKPRTAYGFAKMHGPLDDELMAEAEFMSGWIALRFLKLPAVAKRHFQNAKAARGTRRDQARSAYWLAQAHLALKQQPEAVANLKDAAAHWFSFYGAISKSVLPETGNCDFRAPPKPSPEEAAVFATLDIAKTAMILKQLDMQPLLVAFFLDTARQLEDPVQITLMLELAERIAPPHVALRAGKVAIQRGFPVEAYALPVLLPKFEVAGENGKVEQALLNALTRQESEFDTSASSRVGARGLMQLMPGTARLVASGNKMKYELGRLTSDPSYNVTLGSSLLASLLSSFDGSYILALAAYNAGPGRVAQWNREFGDPRTAGVDPIDWIERIPFNETRDYVQRILESTQLYRCRLEQGKIKVQILQDINRGRPAKLQGTYSAVLPEAPRD